MKGEEKGSKGFSLGGHLKDPHDFVKTHAFVPGPGNYGDVAHDMGKVDGRFAMAKEKKSPSYISTVVKAPPPGSYSPRDDFTTMIKGGSCFGKEKRPDIANKGNVPGPG